jgi:aminoglycoside phosphotransferase (APT) family kinase protein
MFASKAQFRMAPIRGSVALPLALRYALAMHEDEVDVDQGQVSRLIAAQFPRWSNLPLRPAPSGGTDNVIFRLGTDMAVRLPRRPSAAGQIAKEQRWLPELARHLPLPVPTPIGMGAPGEAFPFRWSVCQWLEGETALAAPIADLGQAAKDLAGFVSALQRIDCAKGPGPGPHNSGRGEPLARRDAETRMAIAELAGMIDTGKATKVWETALAAQVYEGEPTWLHGDLHPGNLITENGRLAAVIDFGCLGTGDPACDLMPAWTVLDAPARETFRATHPVDDAAWARGRGWALSMGLIALPYYLDTNPVLVAIARRAIAQALMG